MTNQILTHLLAALPGLALCMYLLSKPRVRQALLFRASTDATRRSVRAVGALRDHGLLDAVYELGTLIEHDPPTPLAVHTPEEHAALIEGLAMRGAYLDAARYAMLRHLGQGDPSYDKENQTEE